MEGLTNPAKKSEVEKTSRAGKAIAAERVKQFLNELYVDSGVLFSQFCDHSLDFVRLDTIKDHFKSNKHRMRKDAKEAQGSGVARPVQCTLSTVVKSKDLTLCTPHVARP